MLMLWKLTCATRCVRTHKQEAAPDGTLYGDLCAPLIEELIAKIDAYRAEQAHKQRMIDLAWRPC